MRLNLAQVKASRIPKVLGICSDDPRLIQWLNEATQRLLTKGLFWGTFAQYRICITDGLITWPRSVASVQTVALCRTPVSVRNGWYEYLDAGPGIQGSLNDDPDTCSGVQCGALNLYDRGTAVTFADIVGDDKKVKVYADNTNDAGKKILIQGYDENDNWILTNDGATQGEEITLAATPVTTSNFFSKVTGIQKEVTKGNVRIYEYDTVTTVQRAMGIYEPTETLPSYRRSLLGGIGSETRCCTETEDECATVTAMVKLEFIPVAGDQDYLIIGNLNALKMATKAVQLEENSNFSESLLLMANAIKELDAELDHYTGASKAVLNVSSGPCNPNVLNLI